MNRAKSLKLLPFILLALVCLGGTRSAEAVVSTANGLQEICPGSLWARAPISVGLSDNEKALVCGTEQVPAWSRVPLNQAMFHFRAILQTKGFHFPQVKQEDGRSVVEVGPRTEVSEIEVRGEAPPFWDVSRFRKVRGQVLTPALLEGFKKRVETDLKRYGYGCPKVVTEGVAQSGKIVLTLKPGRQAVIRSVAQDPIPGLAFPALTRFYAFDTGFLYDARSLLLSGQRMETDGILQSTYFETVCDDGFVDIKQHHMAGAPRILSFGSGLNTERGLIGYANWKHARLGELGSSLGIESVFSYRDTRRNRQEFKVVGKWYGLTDAKRLYLNTTASLVHQSHENYHNLILKVDTTPTLTWDSQSFGGTIAIGPSFTGEAMYRGSGPARAFYTSLKGSARWIEHELELNYADPSSGLELYGQAEASDSRLLSGVTAQNFSTDGRWLWNIGDLSPATFIFGLRWKAAVTFAPDSRGGFNKLPTSLRNFLGGSKSLRGYALDELPGPQGAATVAYLGSEFRVAEVLPWGLQPIGLFDMSKIGSESLYLDSPLYFSAGMGLRWKSPFGVFRTTLARGWASGRAGNAGQPTHSQWQWLVGYGDEF